MSVLPRLALGLGILALGISCQSKSPLVTTSPTGDQELSGIPDYLPAVAALSTGSAAAYEGTLGAWTLEYAGGAASLIPARNLSATPGVGTYEVDVTDAFARTFCRDCVRIQSVTVDPDGRPVITIAATHPFPVGDPGLPPTAQNRRDLYLFNVKGMLVGTNSTSVNIASVIAPTDLLHEPDGYFRLPAGLMETGALAENTFPYMVFNVEESLIGLGNFDAVTGRFSDMDNPTGFNVLGQGQTGTASFTLDVAPGETASFEFRMLGRYGQSVVDKNQRLAPTYYPAEFADGPWRVQLDPLAPFSTAPGDFQNATVSVSDFAMAHGTLDPAFPSANYLGTSWDPALTVEIFALDLQGVQFTPGTAPSGTGDPGDPLVYTVTMNNADAAPNGFYNGMVKVTSNRPVGTANPGEANDVSGIKADLNATTLIDINEIATYMFFEYEVLTVTGIPPTAELAASQNPIMVGNGTYLYPGPGTTDPDGMIVEYAYDFDWDGTPGNFAADVFETTAEPVAHRYTTAGSFTAGLRVKDDGNNYAYDNLTIVVNPVGDPFPPAQVQSFFSSDADTLFSTSDHVPVAIDYHNPGNVYILQDQNPATGDAWHIYRSKDFGATFDTGTEVYNTLRLHPGDNFTWISGRGIAVLADGTLGLVCNTTATTGVDGRGVYYAWIDVDQNGTGVNPGGGAHDLVRVNQFTALESWGDPCVWGDAIDPTRAYVTFYHNPTGADAVHFAAISSANTPNPLRLYDDILLDTTEGLAIDNVRSYLDPATNHLHIVWEEFLTSTDRWIGYSKIVLNNPVGPRARISAMANFGHIAIMQAPSVAITSGGQAVVSWTVDYDPTSVADYDLTLAKIQDNSGTLSFITPTTRLTQANGQNYSFMFGDRNTGRLTLLYRSGGTTGAVAPTDVQYAMFDNNLNLVAGPSQFQLLDPGVTFDHRYPFGAIDVNTGQVFGMSQEKDPGGENTAYRRSQ